MQDLKDEAPPDGELVEIIRLNAFVQSLRRECQSQAENLKVLKANLKESEKELIRFIGGLSETHPLFDAKGEQV